VKLKKLTHKSIKPYGWIIDEACVKDTGRGNAFGILFKERSAGWRIAYLIVREKAIKRLECHNSLETFEPVRGKMAIILAAPKSPARSKLFLLDKPIVLKKGTWHDVAAISSRADVKIVENIEVGSRYFNLAKPIKIKIGE